ncbi:MAG: hypothetical protein M1825_004452 [Sarcosagium campestre]|nr:MAG: hypothetical protein M1825_004452 [Sarcosagium campestre]
MVESNPSGPLGQQHAGSANRTPASKTSGKRCRQVVPMNPLLADIATALRADADIRHRAFALMVYDENNCTRTFTSSSAECFKDSAAGRRASNSFAKAIEHSSNEKSDRDLGKIVDSSDNSAAGTLPSDVSLNDDSHEDEVQESCLLRSETDVSSALTRKGVLQAGREDISDPDPNSCLATEPQSSFKRPRRSQSSECRMVELKLKDRGAVSAYYLNVLSACQQLNCRMIAKQWIKTIHPRKQKDHPYKDGQSSAPDWWPKDVLHKEPDHVRKNPRMKLLLHIINLRKVPIQELEASTACMAWRAPLDAKHTLGELYKVARVDETFMSPDIWIDPETSVFVKEAYTCSRPVKDCDEGEHSDFEDLEDDHLEFENHSYDDELSLRDDGDEIMFNGSGSNMSSPALVASFATEETATLDCASSSRKHEPAKDSRFGDDLQLSSIKQEMAPRAEGISEVADASPSIKKHPDTITLHANGSSVNLSSFGDMESLSDGWQKIPAATPSAVIYNRNLRSPMISGSSLDSYRPVKSADDHLPHCLQRMDSAGMQSSDSRVCLGLDDSNSQIAQLNPRMAMANFQPQQLIDAQHSEANSMSVWPPSCGPYGASTKRFSLAQSAASTLVPAPNTSFESSTSSIHTTEPLMDAAVIDANSHIDTFATASRLPYLTVEDRTMSTFYPNSSGVFESSMIDGFNQHSYLD